MLKIIKTLKRNNKKNNLVIIRYFSSNGSNNHKNHVFKTSQDYRYKDSFMQRLAGSDWGDRRGQKISFTMKMYWSLFAIIVGSGLFNTYLNGGDTDPDDGVMASVKKATKRILLPFKVTDTNSSSKNMYLDRETESDVAKNDWKEEDTLLKENVNDKFTRKINKLRPLDYSKSMIRSDHMNMQTNHPPTLVK